MDQSSDTNDSDSSDPDLASRYVVKWLKAQYLKLASAKETEEVDVTSIEVTIPKVFRLSSGIARGITNLVLNGKVTLSPNMSVDVLLEILSKKMNRPLEDFRQALDGTPYISNATTNEISRPNLSQDDVGQHGTSASDIDPEAIEVVSTDVIYSSTLSTDETAESFCSLNTIDGTDSEAIHVEVDCTTNNNDLPSANNTSTASIASNELSHKYVSQDDVGQHGAIANDIDLDAIERFNGSTDSNSPPNFIVTPGEEPLPFQMSKMCNEVRQVIDRVMDSQLEDEEETKPSYIKMIFKREKNKITKKIHNGLQRDLPAIIKSVIMILISLALIAFLWFVMNAMFRLQS